MTLVLAKDKMDKKLISTLFDGTKVFLVDGKWIRDNCGEEAVDFIYGGHGYVYKFIPKNEIWIEKMLHPEEEALWVVHEIFEWVRMKYQGEKYETAHEKADEVEHLVRKMLNATSKLRTLLAQTSPQLKREPTPTNSRKPVPGLQGSLIKRYEGAKGTTYCNWLTEHLDDASINQLIEAIAMKYHLPNHDYNKEGIASIKYSPDAAHMHKPFFLTWDKDKNEVSLYLVAAFRLSGLAKLKATLLKRKALA